MHLYGTVRKKIFNQYCHHHPITIRIIVNADHHHQILFLLPLLLQLHYCHHHHRIITMMKTMRATTLISLMFLTMYNFKYYQNLKRNCLLNGPSNIVNFLLFQISTVVQDSTFSIETEGPIKAP